MPIMAYLCKRSNELIVTTAMDDRIIKGTTGQAVELFRADQESTFEFDNFKLRVP